ncbi:MAG: hypothetical protein P8M58_08130 [Candidatus Marinimicrobia bacterium]|nr:hypothetical protein [Candidatus Neomarinimicrobiota bacterium]
MKKISLLLITITTIASAQLRLGLDVSREMTVAGMSSEKSEGIGFTLGYEQMLLSLLGVGAEYTAGGDEGVDMLYGYAVGKIPVGVPMARGIIRVGYSLPMGDASEFYEAGLAYGGGLRIKPPIFPIGIEALYTIHNLEMKSSGDEMEDMFMDLLKMKWNVLNITATYSF